MTAVILVSGQCVSECMQSCALCLLGYATETLLMQEVATTDIKVLECFVEQRFCGCPKAMQACWFHNNYCGLFDVVTTLPSARQEWLGVSITRVTTAATRTAISTTILSAHRKSRHDRRQFQVKFDSIS